MNDQQVAQTYVDVLADEFEDTARWRHSKAEQYPEDARNSRCAMALEQAAEYLRSLDDPERNHGIALFSQFNAELEAWQGSLAEPFLVVATNRSAARFFFDNGSRAATSRDFDRLILDAYTESLEACAQAWRDNDIEMTPPRSLVDMFKEAGVDLWRDEEDGF